MSIRKVQILEWLHSQNVNRVDAAVEARALALFGGVSARTLRAAFIESRLPLDPLVEGVRQDTPEHLARTLRALAKEYESGDSGRRGQVRALVKSARQHAAFAARRKPKDEDLLWLRTWLENPLVFAAWLTIRRRACGSPEDAI